MTFDAVDRSGTFSVKYVMRETKFGDASVLPLWVADMDLPAPPCVCDAIASRAAHPIYGYTAYPDAYEEAIVSWYRKRYGATVERKAIVPAQGVVPSLYDAIRAFSAKGEGVIVMPPVYPPFFDAIKRQERRTVSVPLRYEKRRYAIDFELLERRAKEASLLLLCSPHNPVGRIWSCDELTRLAAIAEQYDLIVVADEIHADIVYKPFVSTLMIDALCKRLVVLNAPSKSFNIAGLHTSYAIVPSDSLRRRFVVEARRRGEGSDANPFGIVALMAAYEEGEAWLEALLGYLQGNIAYVRDFCRQHRLPIEPNEPEATYLMWLDCRKMGLSDAKLRRFFIEKAGLGLNDGVSFGAGGEGFMRLNIATSRDILGEAMRRLKDAF